MNNLIYRNLIYFQVVDLPESFRRFKITPVIKFAVTVLGFIVALSGKFTSIGVKPK